MAEITERAMHDFFALEQPPSGGFSMEALLGFGEDEWVDRYDQITTMLANTDPGSESLPDKLIIGERRAADEVFDRKRTAARRLAVEAILSDPDLPGLERLQYLAHVETGSELVGEGTYPHNAIAKNILDALRARAPDGLVLQLNFSESAESRREKLLGGAEPYRFNTRYPARYVFDRAPSNGEGQHPELLTLESGLHLRYHLEAMRWMAARHDDVVPTAPVYRMYSGEADFQRWWPSIVGPPWGERPYPYTLDSPVILMGRREIENYVEAHMLAGGTRLQAIKHAVGDYSGFNFLSDIIARDFIGSDKELVDEALLTAMEES